MVPYTNLFLYPERYGEMYQYDAIGNPLNDGTWTYTWQAGRQLASMSKTGTTATFLYNADGLRVRKTVNSTVTNYTLHGRNVMHLTQGSNSLHFFYDASGRPSHVNYNGAMYLYVHNLQGDIIAIRDAAGNNVVTYSYNAWGKPISKAGSMAGTLGTLNPFRYRGYVYDEKTGLYYLRSRYYNPGWGRFVNADHIYSEFSCVLPHNLFCKCTNSPIIYRDSNGIYKELSIDSIEPFGANDWGTNTSKMPVSVMIHVAIGLVEDGYWVYQEGAMVYTAAGVKLLDCVALFNLPAKFWMNKSTYRETFDVRNNTKGIYQANLVNGLKPIPFNDLHALPIGAIIFNKNKSYVYMYIGYYESPDGTIIPYAVVQAESVNFNKVIVQSIYDSKAVLFGELSYVVNDVTYEDTVARYYPYLVRD